MPEVRDELEVRRAIGARLEAVRTSVGISRRTIANFAEVTPTTVQNFESGKTCASLIYVARLAQFGRVDLEALMLDLSGVMK